jgi:nucleotide-binding universal stress UspA family protein
VFAAELASAVGAEVTVLHVRERAVHPRVPSIESPTDAQSLIDEAVFCLRQAGIAAAGRLRSARVDQVARCIVCESGESWCDAVVLGSRRLRRIERASGVACGNASSGPRSFRCSSRRPRPSTRFISPTRAQP